MDIWSLNGFPWIAISVDGMKVLINMKCKNNGLETYPKQTMFY